MTLKAFVSDSIQFQSTPVIANGRIAMPSSTMIARAAFQSTPVIANGRIHYVSAQSIIDEMFQSTPVIANGRIPEIHDQRANLVVVSIHARYC